MIQRGSFVKIANTAIPSLYAHQQGKMFDILQKLLNASNQEALVTVVREAIGLAQVSIDSELTWYHLSDLTEI